MLLEEKSTRNKLFRIHPENPRPLLSAIIILGFASLITFAVYRHAWISDDAIITLRYVSNTLHGYGVVFNVGDRLQGYSHPLWFLLLLVGSAIFSDPVLVAIGYGLVFTFAMALLVSSFVFRLAPGLSAAFRMLSFYGMLLVISKPWLSFQTSGLENALSHFLIVIILIESYLHGISRRGWLVFLLSLLCLNRPDFVFFVAPLGLLMIANIRSRPQAGEMILGSLPALAWLLFSWFYYGDLIPNTAYAKLGNYATLEFALEQGWYYLVDWFQYDTLAAGSTFVFTLLLLFKGRHSPPIYVCVIGIVLYFLWIIWTGGDFMRGRLFMPVFVTISFLGLLWTGKQIQSNRPVDRLIRWGGLLLAAFLLANQTLTPDPGGEISDTGIVDERAYYPGYHLEPYLLNSFSDHPYLDLAFVEDLKAYAEKCGPFTFHDENPGLQGYLAGPKVTIIDTLGLTDAYIAKLPREYVIDPSPRPGHAEKAVPLAYYESRGVISIYPGWRAAISALNCDFPAE